MLAVGTRLQDFTTGSNTLFAQAQLISLNVNTFDALKRRGKRARRAQLGLQKAIGVVAGWKKALPIVAQDRIGSGAVADDCCRHHRQRKWSCPTKAK